MRNLLINNENLHLMTSGQGDVYNVKRLLNNNALTQSQSIKFGKIFEKFIKDLIKGQGFELINEEYVDVYGIGSKTNKGKKDLDICFIKGDTIFYFESKLNLALDSEKSKATDDKIVEITNYLVENNKDMKVVSGLITCWFEKEKNMVITPKTNLFFIQDFLELIGIEIEKEEYYNMMSDFGKLIVGNN
jgi:hypothetical protein